MILEIFSGCVSSVSTLEFGIGGSFKNLDFGVGQLSRHRYWVRFLSLGTLVSGKVKSLDLEEVFGEFMSFLSSSIFLFSFRSRKALMSFSIKVLGVLISELREIVFYKSLSAISFQMDSSAGVRICDHIRKMSDTFCESDLVSSIKFGNGSLLG